MHFALVVVLLNASPGSVDPAFQHTLESMGAGLHLKGVEQLPAPSGEFAYQTPDHAVEVRYRVLAIERLPRDLTETLAAALKNAATGPATNLSRMPAAALAVVGADVGSEGSFVPSPALGYGFRAGRAAMYASTGRGVVRILVLGESAAAADAEKRRAFASLVFAGVPRSPAPNGVSQGVGLAAPASPAALTGALTGSHSESGAGTGLATSFWSTYHFDGHGHFTQETSTSSYSTGFMGGPCVQGTCAYTGPRHFTSRTREAGNYRLAGSRLHLQPAKGEALDCEVRLAGATVAGFTCGSISYSR